MTVNDSGAVRSIWRGGLVALLGVALGCLQLLYVPAARADEPVATFNIPAQPLASALNSLAVQGNVQMLFEQGPVAGLQSPGITGNYTVTQAMQALLAHTNLGFLRNSDGTVVVSQKHDGVRSARKATPGASPTPAPAQSPALAATTAPQSVRDREGPWVVRARAVYVDPARRSDAFVLPGAPPQTIPRDGLWSSGRGSAELDGEYFFDPHWSAELALNAPQVHDLVASNPALAGGPRVIGSYRLTPNVLTIKYNFLPDAGVRPYIGFGLNVTGFYSVHAAPIDLGGTTVGPAAQLGLDIPLGGNWALNADIKYARARPSIEVNGARSGELVVDPVLYGIGIGYRFGGHAAAVAVLPPPAPVTQAPVAAMPPPAPLDSDGDGVPDSADKCPNTPPGVAVDAEGCPLDSDRDGVRDNLDACPGTPAGLKVDANGCEIEELVLRGVTFETNSATLTAESSAALDGVVSILRQRPDSKAEIHGYTDDRGTVAYNQKLSQRRAAAVAAYLATHGVPGANLTSRGYGESDPVATNSTAQGRAQNRRVSVQFSAPVHK